MGFLHWLSECDAPLLPFGTPKTPNSDVLRIQNDNPDPTYQDCWPSERYKSDGPERAVSTTASGTCRADQCPECRSAPGQPHASGCDDAAKVTDSVINVESCPECGAVTDLDYGMDIDVDRWSIGGNNEGFSVPFKVQEFIFEELAEVQAEYLHDILKDHTPLIIEMARDRFRKGYAKYGSAAYQWDAETRLTNVLEELADSVVYLTSGGIE